MGTTYTETQIMMTLAAFAATGAAERPSGEPLHEHTARISHGITALLADTELATQGAWTLTWVGQTASRANLAYIAQGTGNGSGPVCALVLRGTVGGSPIDTAEDMQVGLMLPFAAGGTTGNISQGAMEAFTDIVMGTDLVAQLTSLAPQTLYVVGHSLGGAMVTTVSLYLAAAGILPASSIYPYTFAAPTAGDATFATSFDGQFPWAICTINYYDVVPFAWATLADLAESSKKDPYYPFYPGERDHPKGPGPTSGPVPNQIGAVINGVLAVLDQLTSQGKSYAQPKPQPALNHLMEPVPKTGKELLFQWDYPADAADSPVRQFEVQVAFQHANNTYLTLLGAPTLPAKAPVVASISPTTGSVGTSVTITPPDHMRFAPDSVVDFGIVPATCTVAQDGSSISVTAPQGVGTVDIRVTNKFGTSPAVPVYPNLTMDSFSDQFTYTAAT